VTAPAAGEVSSCTVTPDFVVVKSGSAVRFWVSTWGADKKPVITKAGATWAAPAGSPLSGNGTGASVEFTAQTEAMTATAAVEAAFGGVKCQAKAIVLPAAPNGNDVAVVVIDELTGRPIVDVDVVVSKADGAIVSQSGSDFRKTDARGYASMSVPGGLADVSVTAFHSEYAYLTIARYAGTSKWLSLYLRRNAVDKYGGYKGTFKNVPPTGFVHAGLAGMSLAGTVTLLSIPQLLGPSEPTDIKIGTAINEKGVGVPSGVFLGFGEQVIKPNVGAQGLAGYCAHSTGGSDEERINKGECGTRSAWALAADVPLKDLPISEFANGLSGLETKIGELLAKIIPIFKRFNSSVLRDVEFGLKATPQVDGKYVFSDQSHFIAVDHEFAQMPLGFSFAAKLAELPKFKGAWADGAILLGGANVPGRGVVPLGIGAAANVTPLDGQTDKQGSLTAQGLVQVRMAPAHHGLEGSEYGVIVAALSAKSFTESWGGAGASAVYARLPSNKLVFDPSGAKPVDLSTLSFPSFPEAARFNFTSGAQKGVAGRSFHFTTVPNFGTAAVIRVSFADELEHRWDVLVDGSESGPAFTLPRPPGVHADRLFRNGLASGERSTLLVQALRLNSNPSGAGKPLSFAEYVEFNSTNADRTTDFLTGFSFLDYVRPSAKFTTPSKRGDSVGKGSKLVVVAQNFRIGTTAAHDGVIRLSFSSGGLPAAGCPSATLEIETKIESGELEYVLPDTCVGTDLGVTAELLGTDKAAPIAPASSVSTVFTVTP
jgi:hypothetical protein